MHRTIRLLAAPAAAAIASFAGAAGLSMTYVGDASGHAIGIRHQPSAAWNAGRASSFSSPTFVGARNFTTSGRTFRTFAHGIAESFAIGDVIAFSQVDVRDLPGGDPTSPGRGLRTDLLSDLYGRYWAFAATDADAGFVAGFQLAIWEIMHENITATTREDAAAQLSLDLGAFQSDHAATFAAFSAYAQGNLMLASLGNGPFETFDDLRGWTDGGLRDRIAAVVVPLPGPGLLAAAGLIGIRSRRRPR